MVHGCVVDGSQCSCASGLPVNGDVGELFAVWRRRYTENSCRLQPVSLLVALTTSPSEAQGLTRSWKLSNNESRLGLFIAMHRGKARLVETRLKFFQDLLVDGVPLQFVMELLHYSGRDDDTRRLEQWPVPKIPLTGRDLMAAGVAVGPEMGRLLRLAKEKWKESYYTMSQEELITCATDHRTIRTS